MQIFLEFFSKHIFKSKEKWHKMQVIVTVNSVDCYMTLCTLVYNVIWQLKKSSILTCIAQISASMIFWLPQKSC